jgi:putative ABC transport system substrate-binding protein
VRRRDALVLLGGATAIAPFAHLRGLAGSAQAAEQTKRIALLMSYSEGDAEGQERVAAFLKSLSEAGWTDGQNAAIEVRWHGGDPDRARAQVKEIVERPPDLIVVNGTPGLAAVQQTTRSIPVIFVVVTDPVGAGFVESLSRPGGNITGFSTFEPEIGGKWLQALTEIAPSVRRVGALLDPQFTGFTGIVQRITALAPSFKVAVIPLHARAAADFDTVIAQFAGPNAGMIVLPTPANSVNRERIFRLSAQHRLPTIYPFSFYARNGGLIAYGFDSVDLFRRAGPYVARILNGGKPGDLAVQAPTKFELVVNLKTAKALGLDVPPALLARADEVIE